MATSKKNKNRTHPVIGKVKEAGGGPPAGAVKIVGHPHNDADTPPGSVDIYPSLENLSLHYRVAQKDIVHEEPEEGTGPIAFHVHSHAPVALLHNATALDQTRHFLVGPVSRSFEFSAKVETTEAAISVFKGNGGVCVQMRSGGTVPC